MSYVDENGKGLREDEKEVYINMFISTREEGPNEKYIGYDDRFKFEQIKTIDEINLEKIIREEKEQDELYTKMLRNKSIDFKIYDKLI